MTRRWLFVGLLMLGGLARGATASRDVHFANGETTLAGTLLLPEGSVAAPAVVFLHGSGCQTRQATEFIATRFVQAGYAALIFDKRGCGSSTGSWLNASLQDLASDAVAAVRFVAQQPGIDSKRVGLWSISQSGWYAPLAANAEPLVSFLIVVTGGGASPRDVERAGYDSALAHRGVTGDDLAGARKLVEQYLDYLATGEKRSELVAAIEQAKGQPWYAAVPLERVMPSEESRGKWSWVATYDPARDIERLHVPILLLFGGADFLMPAASLDRWSAALKYASSARATIRVFPEAGHGIVVGEHMAMTPGRVPTYAVGYVETMTAWLAAVTSRAPKP